MKKDDVELKSFIKEVEGDNEHTMALLNVEQASFQELYRQALLDHHRLVSPFPTKDISHLSRVLSKHSQFYLLIFLSSLLIFYFFERLHLVSISVLIFLAMRAIHPSFDKLLGHGMRSQRNTWKILMMVMFFALIVIGHVMPFLISIWKMQLVRSIAMTAGVLLLVELIAWDLIIMPLGLVVYKRCLKNTNQKQLGRPPLGNRKYL